MCFHKIWPKINHISRNSYLFPLQMILLYTSPGVRGAFLELVEGKLNWGYSQLVLVVSKQALPHTANISLTIPVHPWHLEVKRVLTWGDRSYQDTNVCYSAHTRSTWGVEKEWSPEHREPSSAAENSSTSHRSLNERNVITMSPNLTIIL